MAGLAAKGYTRAAVACTFSTSGCQNSRNEVLALLAEAFGNPSVWSQHVTKGIINLLYSTTSFVTSWNQSTSPYGWIWPRLGIPRAMHPEAPQAKKSCSLWVVGECHRQKLKHFVKGAFRASNTKTNMTNGIQLLTVAVFFTFKCASFSLKMQPMKWYEWVRCCSWRLHGCDLGYETLWPIPQWKTRSSTSRKARMNFGTGTRECWAESLNGSWQMRWPASFMHIWKRRSQKDLRRSYPSHVYVLLFVKPDPGHAIGEELAASVGTGTCGHSQLQVSTKADLQRLAWLSRLSTLSELYTPQKQVWDLTSWKHDTTCEASICLVHC